MIPIMLNLLLELLLPMRNGLKQELKNISSNPSRVDVDVVNVRQLTIKLIINTIYGLLARLYFTVVNTVLVNNITGRARLYNYTMSRCFKGFQTITDGHQYQLQNVYKLVLSGSNKRTGLQTISSYEGMDGYPFLERTSLGNYNWFDIFSTEELLKDFREKLDALAEEHYKLFWSVYDVNNSYRLEHESKYLCNAFLL